MSATSSLYGDLETAFPNHELVLDAVLTSADARELMRFCLAMFDAEDLEPTRYHLSGTSVCFRVACRDHTQIARLERRVDHVREINRKGWSVMIGRRRQAVAA